MRLLVWLDVLLGMSAAQAESGSSEFGLWNCSGVANSGVVDVTSCLQACIDEAYARRLALYLPSGRYLVSAPLIAKQTPEGLPGGVGAGINLTPARFWPNVLIGSTRDLPRRPTIILKANSPEFGDASNTSNVLKITNPNGFDENYSMNQVRGITYYLLQTLTTYCFLLLSPPRPPRRDTGYVWVHIPLTEVENAHTTLEFTRELAQPPVFRPTGALRVALVLEDVSNMLRGAPGQAVYRTCGQIIALELHTSAT